MSRYRQSLPQLSGELFISDGGLETDLIFHYGAHLPQNASYVLLDDGAGINRLTRYFEDYLGISDTYRLGIVLETATWRASPDWAAKIGTSLEHLAALNRRGVEMLLALRERRSGAAPPLVISGSIGPRSDAYQPTEIMTPDEAEAYHSFQVGIFSETAADLVTAMTLTNVPEAVGIAQAARAAAMPVALSFTVETDGCLPTGQTLRTAIEETDAATDGYASYFMINCAHPSHFDTVLEQGTKWTERIHGLRANSSCKSHAELNESPTLDEGNPPELSQQYRSLVDRYPHINVLGGCCGTDHRHIRAIAEACAAK